MQNVGVDWMDGWMDTPQTVTTARAPAVLKISEVEVCYSYAENMYSFPSSKVEKYPFNLFATKPELTLQRSWCGGRFL